MHYHMHAYTCILPTGPPAAVEPERFRGEGGRGRLLAPHALTLLSHAGLEVEM